MSQDSWDPPLNLSEITNRLGVLTTKTLGCSLALCNIDHLLEPHTPAPAKRLRKRFTEESVHLLPFITSPLKEAVFTRCCGVLHFYSYLALS